MTTVAWQQEDAPDAPHGADDLNGGYRAGVSTPPDAQPMEHREPMSAFGAALFAFGVAQMRAAAPAVTIDRAAAYEELLRHEEWLDEYREGHR